MAIRACFRGVARTYRAAYADLPLDVWVIAGAMLVNRLGTMVFPFLSLFLTEELGLSETYAGQMLGIYGAGGLVGVILSGRLIRAIGSVRSQIVLFILVLPCFIAVPLASTPIAVACTLAVLGLVSEAVRPANSTTVSRLTPADLHTRAFGLQRMAINLGFSFGPAIGGVLAVYSFTYLFWVDGLTNLACGVVLLFHFGWNRHQSKINRLSEAEPRAAEPLEALASNGSDLPANPEDRMKRRDSGAKGGTPWSDPPFLFLCLLLVLTSIVFFQITCTFPLYLHQQLGMSKPTIGALFALNTVIIVAFEMILLERLRRYDSLHVIAVGAALSCLGFASLWVCQKPWHSMGSMIVITAGEMLWMPVSAGWTATRSRRGDDGQYMAFYTASYSISVIIAPMLGGWLYDDDPVHPWRLAAIATITLPCGFWYLSRWLKMEMKAIRTIGGAT